MKDDPAQDPLVTYSYDFAGRVTRVPDGGFVADPMTCVAESLSPPVSPAFAFEHNATQGVFRLTCSDGRVEVFRDKPARQLGVEPDESGAVRPVVQGGRPVCFFPRREEREVR